MATDGRGYARPTSRDYLDTAERYAREGANHLFHACCLLAKAGEIELAEEATELRDKAKALSARVSARYYGEATNGD